MRHTRSHTGNRRSHHALEKLALSKCAKCGAQHLRHRVCLACGSYRGRTVIDVVAKAEKQAAKKKAAAKK
jgi:large subunit ribosomal protein L32